MNRVVLILFLLLQLVFIVTATEKMIVILTHADVQEDPKYVNTTVAIQRYARAPYFSFDLTIVTLQKLTDLKLQALYSVRMGTADNVLYNRQIDFCAFLKQPTERVLKMIYDDMKRNAKTPIPRCPVRPTRIVLQNISLNLKLPTFLPQTNFRLQINFWEGAKSVFRSQWYGRLNKVRV